MRITKLYFVIPAEAGIQRNKERLGSRFRGNDEEKR
jgi:hypothetical protein